MADNAMPRVSLRRLGQREHGDAGGARAECSCSNPSSLLAEPPAPGRPIEAEAVDGALWEVDLEASSLYSNISTIDLYKHCHPGRPFPFRLYWVFTEFAMKTHFSNGVLTYQWYHEEDLKLCEMVFVGKQQVKNSEVMGRVEIDSKMSDDGTCIENKVTLLAEDGRPSYDERYYMSEDGQSIYIVAVIHSTEPIGAPDTPRQDRGVDLGVPSHKEMDLAARGHPRHDMTTLTKAIPSQLRRMRQEKLLSHSLPQLTQLSRDVKEPIRSAHVCDVYQSVTVWRRVESSVHYTRKASTSNLSVGRARGSDGSLPRHVKLGLQHVESHTKAYASEEGKNNAANKPQGLANAYAQTPVTDVEDCPTPGRGEIFAMDSLDSDSESEKEVPSIYWGDRPGSSSQVETGYLGTNDVPASVYRRVTSKSPLPARKSGKGDGTASRLAAAPLSYFGKSTSLDELHEPPACPAEAEEDAPHVMTGEAPLTEEWALNAIHEMSENSAKEVLSKLMLGAHGEENRKRLADHCASADQHKKAYELHGGRDWNSEYQQLMDERLLPSYEEKDWCAKMYRLEADFSHAGSLYAQVIINELSLPPSQKTILPVKIGGEAGGIKYMVNGILFKFAKDSIVYGDTYMYGGKVPRHDLAKKAARLELQGLSCFIAAGSTKLRLPLMTTIDYLGHRMVATSILPISHDTLRYGSADGGATVHADTPELNEEMRYVGEFWNLAEHSVGKSNKLLFTPGDLEGHQGKDGRYYVCDFARLMPPESPSWEHVEVGREVFYKLLRPELVIRYAQRLSPDTFTGWGAYDHARPHQEAAIIGCSQYLYEKVIPRVAAKLDDLYFSDNPYASTPAKWLQMPSSKLADLLDRVSVSTQMHFAGVNFRHIGLVRRHSRCASVKLLLLCYAVGRVVKNLIRLDMFRTMTKLSHPSDLEFRMEILDHLNCLLSNHVFALPPEQLDEAKLPPAARKELAFWARVEAALHEQFEHCWTPEEGTGALALLRSIDRRIVLHYLLACSGIKLSRSVSRQLLESTHENTFTGFVIADIKYPKPRAKQPFLYDIVAAKLLLPSDDSIDSLCVSPQDLTGKLRQIQLAKEKCKRAWKQVPLSPHTSYTFARIVLRGVELSLQSSDPPSWSLYYDLNLASTGLEMCSKVFPTTQTMSLWRKLLLLSSKLCHVYSQHADSKFQEDNLSEILLRLQEKILFLEGMSDKLPAIHNTDAPTF